MNKLWFDSETRCVIPIKRGTYKYASQATMTVATFAMNDEPVLRHDFLADPVPPRELIQRIIHCDTMTAHNAIFDRKILERQAWFRALNFPLAKWRCMMARAYRHGLPGKLEKLSEIFQLGADGKLDGQWLIKFFCMPIQGTERFREPADFPMEWELFLDYATQDIVAMRALDIKIPSWNETRFEHHLWMIDQIRNDRGFPVDLEFCRALVQVVKECSERMALRTQQITDGEVLKTTQRDRLLVWLLKEYGVDLPDLRADTITRRLEDPELPEMVKEILRIRIAASKASISKAKRVLEGEIDGRIHGAIQYGGALRTLRDAGRIVQPQNMPRPKHKHYEIEAFIAGAKRGDVHLYMDDDEIMALAASSMRGMIAVAHQEAA